jgi:hypothetical protein
MQVDMDVYYTERSESAASLLQPRPVVPISPRSPELWKFVLVSVLTYESQSFGIPRGGFRGGVGLVARSAVPLATRCTSPG